MFRTTAPCPTPGVRRHRRTPGRQNDPRARAGTQQGGEILLTGDCVAQGECRASGERTRGRGPRARELEQRDRRGRCARTGAAAWSGRVRAAAEPEEKAKPDRNEEGEPDRHEPCAVDLVSCRSGGRPCSYDHWSTCGQPESVGWENLAVGPGRAFIRGGEVLERLPDGIASADSSFAPTPSPTIWATRVEPDRDRSRKRSSCRGFVSWSTTSLRR